MAKKMSKGNERKQGEIIGKYYYIIYFRDFLKPKIFPVHFMNRKAAERALKSFVAKKRRTLYGVIRGSKLKEHDLDFLKGLGNVGKFTKYDYPKDLTIARKSYRTQVRRRLRRMNMLTLVKNKIPINKPIQYIKLIKNTQKIAMTPKTSAKGFQVERKPKHIYNLILDKKISTKKGILFEIDTYRVDIKRKEISKEKVYVRRNDIIIPYLLHQIEEFYGEPILEYRRAINFK
jgi:hypothetical protein